MSSFPALSALRALCFPGGADGADNSGLLQTVSDIILKRVLTRPRAGAKTHRHPETQAGLVLEEDGSALLRAGHILYDHSVGATLVLRPDDTVVLTAPAGLLLSGALLTSDTPTDALNMAGFQFSPAWETAPIITTLNAALLNTVFVAGAPNAPADIPLSAVLQAAALYQTPGDILNGE